MVLKKVKLVGEDGGLKSAGLQLASGGIEYYHSYIGGIIIPQIEDAVVEQLKYKYNLKEEAIKDVKVTDNEKYVAPVTARRKVRASSEKDKLMEEAAKLYSKANLLHDKAFEFDKEAKKLWAEANKLREEASKLYAEADKIKSTKTVRASTWTSEEAFPKVEMIYKDNAPYISVDFSEDEVEPTIEWLTTNKTETTRDWAARLKDAGVPDNIIARIMS